MKCTHVLIKFIELFVSLRIAHLIIVIKRVIMLSKWEASRIKVRRYLVINI